VIAFFSPLIHIPSKNKDGFMGDGKEDQCSGNHFDDDYNDSLSFTQKKRERVYFFKWEIELFGRLDNELSGDTPDHNSEELINRQVRKAVKKLSYEERESISSKGYIEGHWTNCESFWLIL
jgi:hypothetical protein